MTDKASVSSVFLCSLELLASSFVSPSVYVREGDGFSRRPSFGGVFDLLDSTQLFSRLDRRLSTNWITLWVHDVGKNLALIFLIVTTSILVSK